MVEPVHDLVEESLLLLLEVDPLVVIHSFLNELHLVANLSSWDLHHRLRCCICRYRDVLELLLKLTHIVLLTSEKITALLRSEEVTVSAVAQAVLGVLVLE